jgi:hypothetical protein
MDSNNIRPVDDIYLLKIIKYLCSTNIRHPMTIEDVKVWLRQFDKGPEYTLALLILRYLIYRTSSQIESSLKQALKKAAIHFIPEGYPLENTHWLDILNNNNAAGLEFIYGPLRNSNSRPGKSGEIISRQLKQCLSLDEAKLGYPDTVKGLQIKERFLLVDDGTFTGEQLIEFIEDNEKENGFFLTQARQTGIVVGLAHENALRELKKKYPSIPIFYGEKITHQECFTSMCERLLDNGMWSYSVTPQDTYEKIVRKARFHKKHPLGYGELGCIIAYEHGVPDNSLQILWDRSTRWQPLFMR